MEAILKCNNGDILVIRDEFENKTNTQTFILSVREDNFGQPKIYGENINPNGNPKMISIFHGRKVI